MRPWAHGARLVAPSTAQPHTHPPIHPPPHPQVAAHVARAVAQKAYEGGFATDMPKPHSLLERARSHMYNPMYRTLR